MKVSLFYLPAIGSRQDIEGGMAGTRPELYTKMIKELSGQAMLADELERKPLTRSATIRSASPNITSRSRAWSSPTIR